MINVEEQPSSSESTQKINNLKISFISILETILEYTSSLGNIKPSIFDNNSKNNVEKELKFNPKVNIDQYDFEDFFKFCLKKFKFDDDLLVLIMMNIDKIISNDNFALTYQNVNRLFYTSLMITQKYYEDNGYNNKLYADLVGITCDELLDMEMEYMNLVDYHLFIKDDEFIKYKQKMIEL